MLNIAIDGTAGSGKSVVAEGIAKKLELKMINSGAIYRSVACEYKKRFGLNENYENVKVLCKDLQIELKFEGDNQLVLINGNDYSSSIRDEDISVLCSQLSVYPEIRQKILIILRDFSSLNNIIMEGRDIGTVVLPNASVKLFLTATLEERALRRYRQVILKDPDADFQKILNDLKERDYRDEHREISPLKIAEDAIVIDNTGKTTNETIELCCQIITKNHKI